MTITVLRGSEIGWVFIKPLLTETLGVLSWSDDKTVSASPESIEMGLSSYIRVAVRLVEPMRLEVLSLAAPPGLEVIS